MRSNSPAEFRLTGDCVCIDCDYKVVHKQGVPCSIVYCPHCGSRMVRDRIG